MHIMIFQGSLIPPSELQLFNIGLLDVIGFFIIGIVVAFGAPDLWQRVFSAKGKKQLRNGFLISIIIYAVVIVFLTLIALTVKVQFPDIDPDFGLIHGFANLLPAGLVGLSVILLFAALMSSIDTYIFTSSSAIIQDFFSLSKKKTIQLIKITMFLVTILAAIFAIIIQDIVQGGFIFVSFTVVLATTTIATWIRKSIKETSLIFGFTLGSIGLIIFLIVNLTQGEIKPTIVLVALAFTLIGIFIGGIYSKIKKPKNKPPHKI